LLCNIARLWSGSLVPSFAPAPSLARPSRGSAVGESSLHSATVCRALPSPARRDDPSTHPFPGPSMRQNPGRPDHRLLIAGARHCPRKSSINLTGLTTYEPAKPPGPLGHFFYPGFLEPPNWLIMFANAVVEIIVFTLALLSIWVLNQQEFREEPVPDSISRNSLLPPSLSLVQWTFGNSGGSTRFFAGRRWVTQAKSCLAQVVT
jgi:hypothetical protein